MKNMPFQLKDPHQNELSYLGPHLDEGKLPAFIYFALSHEESLTLHPYNRPAELLSQFPLRIFSFTLPGHGGNLNKFHALSYWANKMCEKEAFLESFFKEVLFGIEWLIQKNVIDPEHLAVGGLSRGAFVATHIAAQDKRIQTVLGFAPLTKLSLLKEFSEKEESNPELFFYSEKYDLIHLVDHLTHLRNLRFYIGNHDTRVGTDACYTFIRKLAETAHEKKARHFSVELMITPSIGHKGHGTAPHLFEEGSFWLKQHLLRS